MSAAGKPVRSVLIVDDDRQIAEVIAMALNGACSQVDVAYSLADGLRALALRRYTLVLLDLTFPGENSVKEVLAAIKTHMAGARVVIITGAPITPHLSAAGLAAGAEAVLGKLDEDFNARLLSLFTA